MLPRVRMQGKMTINKILRHGILIPSPHQILDRNQRDALGNSHHCSSQRQVQRELVSDLRVSVDV